MSSPYPNSDSPRLASVMAANGIPHPSGQPAVQYGTAPPSGTGEASAAMQAPPSAYPPVQPAPVPVEPQREQFAAAQQYQQVDTAQPAESSVSQELTEQFRSRGFTIPDGMTSSEVMDAVSEQLDEANQIRQRASEGGYRPAPGMQSPQGQPSAAQAVPASQQSVSDRQSQSASPVSTKKVSDEAQAVARAGLVTRGENGWESSNVAFQQFADELNSYEARRQATLAQLADDPDEFIAQRTRQLGLPSQSVIDSLYEEVQSLKAQIREQSTSSVDREFDSWVDQNQSSLFVNGDRNRLTTYAQKYNEFASHVSDLASDMGQELTKGDLHRRTLQLMKSAGQALSPQSSGSPQSSAPQPAPQSPFMQMASETPPRSSHDRLVDYAAQQPTGSSYVPAGRQGLPSFRGIVNQIKNAT
jgi:hypothetical protein